MNTLNFNFVDKYTNIGRGEVTFRHTSVLRMGDQTLCKGCASYCNRTWENYPYQTTRKKAVENAILKYPEIVKELSEFLLTL